VEVHIFYVDVEVEVTYMAYAGAPLDRTNLHVNIHI
jgi:hypothetical protein